jgi:hypothetical protein
MNFVQPILPKSLAQKFYKIGGYLFACWMLYSILRTFIPGPENLFANKLFLFFAAAMASKGFGPYHGMWHEYSQPSA